MTYISSKISWIFFQIKELRALTVIENNVRNNNNIRKKEYVRVKHS